MRLIITLFFLFPSIGVPAQNGISYQEANIQTYDAAMKHDWHRVIELSEKAKSAGHNFFYLNLRLGIAYYNTKQYFKAKKALTNAYNQNKSDSICLQYNYWNSIAIGDNYLAEFYSKSILLKKSFIKNISLTSGLKKFNISEMGSNQYHLNISSQLRLTSRLSSTIYASRITQKMIWGEYDQNQISVRNHYQISPKIKIELNYNSMQNRGTVHYTNVENTLTKSGSLNQRTNSLYAGSGFDLNRSKLEFGFLYHNIYSSNDLELTNNNTNTKVNISPPSTSHHFQPNIGFQHYFKPNNNGIWFSSQISVPFSSDSLGISLNNVLKIKATKKSWIGINYHYNSKINAIEDNGLTIQNGDFLSTRFGFSWQYKLNSYTNIKLDLIRENKTEYFESIDYNYNSIFGTLTFKL